MTRRPAYLILRPDSGETKMFRSKRLAVNELARAAMSSQIGHAGMFCIRQWNMSSREYKRAKKEERK